MYHRSRWRCSLLGHPVTFVEFSRWAIWPPVARRGEQRQQLSHLCCRGLPMRSTVNIPGFPLATFVFTLILLSLLLAACGGGDTAPTEAPTSVPATPAPPATDPPEPATAVPAPTAPPAATGSPGPGAATAESPTASPTAAATSAPTVAPTEVLASNAVRVLRRSCVEEFPADALGLRRGSRV